MNKEKLIGFCQNLIRLKSLSGDEGAVAELIIQEMNDLGYDEVQRDSYGNVIGKINGNGKKSIMFEGHMDVVGVPTPDDWTVHPFGGELKDGRIWGRGTADMKCALAAMIYGAAEMKLKDHEADVYVAAVVFEEIFEGVGFGKVLDKIKPDAVVLGEASALAICVGQKGRAEIELEADGVNAHSATPDRGVNAIYNMLPLLEKVKSLPVPLSEDLGEGILVTTDIISSPYPGSSVIPDKCKATLDRRLIEGETVESVLAPIKKCIEEISKNDQNFRASVRLAEEYRKCYTGEEIGSERFYPGWKLSGDAPLISKSKEAYKSLGLIPRFTTYPFCTDGSESAGRRGIPTIGIGPSKTTMAHVVDENVDIGEIELVADIYAELASVF